GFAFIGLNFSRQPNITLMWSRLYAVCLLFAPPLFYHLVLGSIGNPLKGHESLLTSFHERLKQLAYVFSGGWFLLVVGGIVPHEMIRQEIFTAPDIGQQFWIAALFFGILISVGMTLLGQQAFLSKDPTQRSRLLY